MESGKMKGRFEGSSELCSHCKCSDFFSCSSVLLLLAMHHRVNRKENHIELSLLPDDTGMPSVLPESLGLPQYGAEEEKREADDEKKKEEPKPKTKRRRENYESGQVWV